jgi:hypothetical protein
VKPLKVNADAGIPPGTAMLVSPGAAEVDLVEVSSALGPDALEIRFKVHVTLRQSRVLVIRNIGGTREP